jgi:Ca2+-dependent lipid-binding protein
LLEKPLHIKLYDYDVLSFDDPLGGVNIDLLPLIEKMAEDEVKETIRDLDTQGSVRLKISWRWCGRSRSNRLQTNTILNRRAPHANSAAFATVSTSTQSVTRCMPVAVAAGPR